MTGLADVDLPKKRTVVLQKLLQQLLMCMNGSFALDLLNDTTLSVSIPPLAVLRSGYSESRWAVGLFWRHF